MRLIDKFNGFIPINVLRRDKPLYLDRQCIDIGASWREKSSFKNRKFIMVYSSQHRTHFSFLNRRSVLKIKPTCYLWSRSQFNKAGCVVNINKALYHMKCAELTALGISNQHFCKRNCMANMILFLSCLFFFHFSQASVFKWTWFYGIKNSN